MMASLLPVYVFCQPTVYLLLLKLSKASVYPTQQGRKVYFLVLKHHTTTIESAVTPPVPFTVYFYLAQYLGLAVAHH